MNLGIVGAGLLGQLLAFNLQKNGHSINIFADTDKQALSSATDSAAGMLTPIIELQTAENVISRLGLCSIKIWKKIIPNFSKSVFYKFNGSIVTAHPEDHAELKRFKQIISSKDKDYKFHELDSKNTTLINSGINLKNGLYFPTDGHIEGSSLIAALNFELDNKNITWHTNTWVQKIEPHNIFTDKAKYRFDTVFDCRGYKAKDSVPDIRGVRGELLYLHAPEVKLNFPIRLLTPRYPVYIVPLPNDHYIIGASEIETEDNSPITVRSTLELLTAAYSIHTGFAEARIIKSKVGHRPALPSNLPQIKLMPGLIAINGLYRHGFLIAPAIVEEALRLLEGGINEAEYSELIVEVYND